MISIENLSVEFGVKPLFTDVNYVINRHDRIALVGKNGAGKSTMLKIIAGIQQPTRGFVGKPKDLSIGYLPQVMNLTDSMTVRQETEKAYANMMQMEEHLAALNQELADRTDYESESYQDLIEKMTDLNEQLTVINSTNRDAEIERTLMGLGFERNDLDRPTSEFSGGWRMRIELAKILLQRPDVLLLDEPTNHLDIESIQWLEKFLANGKSTLLLISHDRAFLDNVTTRTIEITCGTIHDYNVNYSKYVVLHAERIEQQRRAYENQQKMIQDTEAFIERFRYQATKAIQVQSRIKQLEKVVPIEIDEVDNSHLNLKFPPAPRSGDYPVICHDVRKAYDHVVFDHVEMTIKRGEKVAFVGRNGEGKSTLVKCIMGQIPFDGELKVGYGVKIGYFAQNQAQLLDEELSVFDTIDRVAVGDIRTKIRDILGAFMFGGEASDKPVKVLSGGERSRLAMIRLLLEPVNLLILDEPTNHLDMASKDVLKKAIQAFDGTVILVSHDRDFLDGLVSKVYEFGHGKVREHLGGIYDYLQKRQLDSLQMLEVKDAPKPAEPVKTESRFSFEEQKAMKQQRSKLEKLVKQAEEEIGRLEKMLSEVEAKMATPKGSQDQQLYIQHADLKKKIDEVSETWMTASEQLEELS
ncbi:MAG: ABC-F family ATP-binding cassette domain-containing protein [Bacteroidales bacterium]|nr:ABC-F family ATP-binding cassette domain-containing protein [Bacteroidales bacterium]MBO7378403.1 ABC-F family ATP-binding cassette domain-containing protein [Bacteroidales bacterium]MBP5765026.1 ABC-F family ATP-binding cassette domain-containing protein [Bacteroidales bacterium]